MTKTNKPLLLGNAARLDTQKGHDKLLLIAQNLRNTGLNFHLKIAGDGPLKEALIEQSKELKLEQYVTFLGHVEDIHGFMRSIDIFTFPSLNEGFGFVLAEAMLHEKPVVAFAVGGIPEVVDNQQDGLLVAPYELEEFTEKVLYLANDPALRIKMGQAGRAKVVQKFNQERQFEEVSDYILEKVSLPKKQKST